MTEKTELSERLALNVDIAKAHGWHVECRHEAFYMNAPYYTQYFPSANNEDDIWIECISDKTIPDWTHDLNLAWPLLIEMHNKYDVEMNIGEIRYWDGLSYEYELIEPLDAESTAYAICRVWKILNEE